MKADLQKAQDENHTVEAKVAEEQIEQLEQELRSHDRACGKARDLNHLLDKLRPRIHNRLKAVYKAMRQSQSMLQEGR